MAGFLQRLTSLFTRKPDASSGLREELAEAHRHNSMLRAKVDAAETTNENKNHWAGADAFAADWAYNPSVRYRLRNRARHETVNNCYAKGAVRAYADDMIGTGPRLQLAIPAPAGEEDAFDAAIAEVEEDFCEWAEADRFAMNLRTAEKSLQRDGECFGILDTDDRLDHPVKLSIRWVEAEQCAAPFGQGQGTDPHLVDGIRYDRLGKPLEYYFFKIHPGSLNFIGLPLQYETIPAAQVLHWFQGDRFGQHRGIPAITPALPIYSQTRRLTLATLTASEFAAAMAGVLKTNLPPSTDTFKPVDAWSLFEVVRAALMALPEGWEMQQMKSEHPNAEYGAFKRELLNETGRATNQPLNVVTGNSSQYNFSSGRLDHLPYQRGIRIDRNDLRLIVLDPIVRAYLREAVLIPGLIPSILPPVDEWGWGWGWDGFDSIDQVKDATADDMRLKNGTSTYAEIFAEYGQNWQQQFDQLAREKREAEKRGLPWPVLSQPASVPAGAPAADNMPAAVAAALAEAGIPEHVQAEIIDALAPTFAALRRASARPGRNGHSRTAGGVA